MSERLALMPHDIAAMPPEALPALLVELAARQNEIAALQTAVAARLAAAAPAAAAPAAPSPSGEAGPCYIDAETAAAIVSVARRVIYGWSRRKDWRVFCHRPSRKVLRIERAAFLAWWDRQSAHSAPMVSCHSVTRRDNGHAKAEPEGRTTST